MVDVRYITDDSGMVLDSVPIFGCEECGAEYTDEDGAEECEDFDLSNGSGTSKGQD